MAKYSCSLESKDRVPFFESFYRAAELDNCKDIEFIDSETCHAGDCTVQIKATKDAPVVIYACNEGQALRARSLLEEMSGKKLFREGWK